MLSENKQDIAQLAKAYFEGELGIAPEDVPEASRNLLGAFGVLYRVNERLKSQQPV
jgi:hypothetical protein